MMFKLDVLVPLSHLVERIARKRRRNPPPDRIRLPIPVISVGNLAIGGVGKTPATMRLVELLREMDKRVGVVMGGYKRKHKTTEWMLVSDGNPSVGAGLRPAPTLFANLDEAGDEGSMFAFVYPDVPFAVGKRKAETARRLAEAVTLDCLILDDGFQHHRLVRDLDIVLLDARDPFGNGRVLPAGRLRELPDALSDADLILLTHADDAADIGAARQSVAAHALAVPILTANHRPYRLRVGGTSETIPLAELSGREVFAVCGIGSPEGFAATLRGLGARTILHPFPDHHRYTSGDLASIVRQAKTSQIVTTAKDEVKFARNGTFPFWTLDIRLEWTPEEPMRHALDALFSPSDLTERPI